MCFWVRLPPGLGAGEVFLEARRCGVIFAPKEIFSVRSGPNDAMRLGFTDQDEAATRAAVRVLGQVLGKLLAAGKTFIPAEVEEYARPRA